MATTTTLSTPAPSGKPSNRFVLVAGFIVAAGTLVLIADEAPTFALGTAALLALGVLVIRSNEIATLLQDWQAVVKLGG